MRQLSKFQQMILNCIVSRDGVVTRRVISEDTGICIETVKWNIRRLKAYGRLENGRMQIVGGKQMAKYDVVEVEEEVCEPSNKTKVPKPLGFGGFTAAHIDMEELQKYM